MQDIDREAVEIMRKYPDRIPCIVTRAECCKDLGIPNKKKYLVPKDLTLGQFTYVIRKRIKMRSSQSLYVVVDNTVPPASEIMRTLYKNHSSKDKLLHMTYQTENTFGSGWGIPHPQTAFGDVR